MILLLILGGLLLAARSWLAAHPGYNPWTPLDLRDAPGWATSMKLSALRTDVDECRAVLRRSDVDFTALEPLGEGACLHVDRTRLEGFPFSPAPPPTTCTVAVALEIWRTATLQPAARDLLGAEIVSVEHLGSYSCRRLYGRDTGPYSEHAVGNAIDIAAFRLADGTRVSVLDDWDDDGAKGAFLREARQGACQVFATVLSPDYNAAHADHFHFDQAGGRWGVCR